MPMKLYAQTGANRKPIRPLPLLLALFIPVCEYLWGLWYYGGLYHSGALLGVLSVSRENLGALLTQHLLSLLPVGLTAIGALLVLKRAFARELGFTLGTRRARLTSAIAGGLYLALLIVRLFLKSDSILASFYGWLYYLFFVALAEELIFRSVLPWLLEKSGVRDAFVWVIPGILFGFMHSLMPLIKEWDGTALHLLSLLISPVLGGLIGGCCFYWLRRRLKTIWFPVLLHAILDYLSTF